ncbi:saccharopine dehydrogenase family protein [Christiangramia crocea]|uniref:Saccharopine dehydrogenase NADP-binding domain-containing protein n=1 Tax=Christiangramia crocea TaxID=2904124 RepID=A0A9X1UVC1_9FLAO|nr:saccharopine dehydrogenase C-terminal domain-containing protein [Gramella crocea]MCG9970735.1 saccharopine dehydrogenase NADP-binding domain-containing protein [Gramella crocea]
MNSQYNIIIAGAGGIARAAGLMLAELSGMVPNLFILNRSLDNAQKMAGWIRKGSSRGIQIECFELPEDETPVRLREALESADILLDCLPGSQAPRMAQLAKDFHLHYANLTEYVSETETIKNLAKDADTGFLLQTGLAPGYIDVLGNHLFQTFCKRYHVEKADSIALKVGALTRHAVAPYYYGFTWSPVGVATEYLKEAAVIRDYKERNLPSLSERNRIIIDGKTYEEDLTSGGAADLPQSLSHKVRKLDYKTLRFPGHYDWVEEQLTLIGHSLHIVDELQQKMEEMIPHIEEDQIILYASVEGKDDKGTRRKLEVSRKILPQKIGNHSLRAIQTTTAAPLLQSAMLLLESSAKGVILQSGIETADFLNGHFIKPVYGEVSLVL